MPNQEPYESMFTPQDATSPVSSVVAGTPNYNLPQPVAPREMNFGEGLGMALRAFGAGMQGKANPMDVYQEQQRHQANTEFNQKMELYRTQNEERRLGIAERIANRAEKKQQDQDTARKAIGQIVINPPTKDVPTGQVGPDGQPAVTKQIDEQGMRQQLLPHLVELSNNPAELKDFVRGSGFSADIIKGVFGVDKNMAEAISGYDAEKQMMLIQGAHKVIQERTKQQQEARAASRQQFVEEHTLIQDANANRRMDQTDRRLDIAERRAGLDKPAQRGQYVQPDGTIAYPNTIEEVNALPKGTKRLDHGSPAEKVFGAVDMLNVHVKQALDQIEQMTGGDSNRLAQMLDQKIGVFKNDPASVALFDTLGNISPVATASMYSAQSGGGMRGGYKLAQMVKKSNPIEGDSLRVMLKSKLKVLAEVAKEGASTYNLPSQKSDTNLSRIESMLGNLNKSGGTSPRGTGPSQKDIDAAKARLGIK